MLDAELLRILCCPETHQALQPAEPALIERLNRQITAGAAKNRGGQQVPEQIEAGLVRADGRFLYPIRHDLPLMLVAEAILLAD